jgi:3-isopropylmalate/(R)-2-methylmalate dehydratase small subunit
MDPISVISGPVSHLDRADVDTDQIMPKQFLKRVERTGFGEFLFFDWAKQPGWDLPANPILVTGENFGCGSSREHAPWGLQDYGFQAILAPSFADIFYSNCTKIGLLPAIVDEAHCKKIAEAGEARIDVDDETIDCGTTGVFPFEVHPDVKHRLLNGLDDIGITLQNVGAIDEYESSGKAHGPVTTSI